MSIRLRGVGVDLISRTRVEKFLHRHRDYARIRFLNRAEQRAYRTLSFQDMAELFTAKEAFFKACGEVWMGLEGFQGMKMVQRDGDYFKMEWRPTQNPRKVYRGEGYFFRSGDLIGAQAMIWR